MVLNNDNEDSRKMVEQCYKQSKTVVNPIIDWTDSDVWEFIHEYNVPYCKLYDEGYKRLGCIGCPMGTVEHRNMEFERYPKYKLAYIRAFDRMINERNWGGTQQHGQTEFRQCSGGSNNEHEAEVRLLDKWRTPQEVIEWWIK